MSASFRPCPGDCGGAICCDGDQSVCTVCDEASCIECAEDWMVITDPDDKEADHRVCHACREVKITPAEQRDELLRLYHALPGSNPALNVDTIIAKLREGRESCYEEFRRDNPKWHSEDSDGEEEEPPVAKQGRVE